MEWSLPDAGIAGGRARPTIALVLIVGISIEAKRSGNTLSSALQVGVDGAGEPRRYESLHQAPAAPARRSAQSFHSRSNHCSASTLTIFKRGLQCTGQRSVAADQLVPAQCHAFAPAFLDQLQTLRIDDQGICPMPDRRSAVRDVRVCPAASSHGSRKIQRPLYRIDVTRCDTCSDAQAPPHPCRVDRCTGQAD